MIGPVPAMHARMREAIKGKRMTTISGSAAAITGAASGIGRALALELAARGCDVAVADVNEAGLASLADEIKRTHQRKVSVHRLDVSQPAQIEEFAKAAIASHPKLNIVVNNAGVALFGQFHEIDQSQIDWLFNINFWGVVHGSRAFRHAARRTLSTSPASSASLLRPGRPPTRRRSSRCAASRRRCATSCRQTRARLPCRSCIRVA